MGHSKQKAVTKYQLWILKINSLILLGILLLNFVLGIVLKSMQETGGSIDPITFIFALVAGFVLQETFPYALYNGVSRKSFFSASIFAVVVTTIAWTALTVILTLLSRAFAANIILYDTIYQSGVFAMAIWYFAAILCLIASGWFFTVLASVLTKRAKLILIGGTVVLAPLLILLDHVTGGVILMLQKFGFLFFGVWNSSVSPYLSAGMFFLLSCVLLFFTWVIIRRKELK